MTDVSPQDVRDFMFRGLLFGADAAAFRQAGIQVGSPEQMDAESRLLSETLEPFSVSARAQAMQMARLYALLYCFENAVRQLIEDRLLEAYGTDWWETAVPAKVRGTAESRRKAATSNVWLDGETARPLSFADFGDLSSIIIDKWGHFEDLIPNQHWIKQRFDEIEQARNFVAHHRFLQPAEFQRLYMYVGDYNRQVGL